MACTLTSHVVHVTDNDLQQALWSVLCIRKARQEHVSDHGRHRSEFGKGLLGIGYLDCLQGEAV